VTAKDTIARLAKSPVFIPTALDTIAFQMAAARRSANLGLTPSELAAAAYADARALLKEASKAAV
jgi:hypothetical protein